MYFARGDALRRALRHDEHTQLPSHTSPANIPFFRALILVWCYVSRPELAPRDHAAANREATKRRSIRCLDAFADEVMHGEPPRTNRTAAATRRTPRIALTRASNAA